MDKLIIFTDGASRGNPGPGGWGTVIVFPKLSEIVELGGGREKTTNNEMELTAALSALSYVSQNDLPIHIYTDSKFMIDGMTSWTKTWSQNNWKKHDGEAVKHREIWQTLQTLANGREIHWHHVPGHAGIPGNERADKIATSFADATPMELYRGNLANYDDPKIAEIDEREFDELSKTSFEKKVIPAFSYVSEIDGVVQTHKTWDECKERVHGQAARYKKVFSEKEKKELIKNWSK